MNNQEIVTLFQDSVIGNYTRVPVAITRGAGSEVWDAEGKRYLDLFPGWGVSALGHCHPKVTAAIRHQAGELLHVPNNFFIEQQGRLARTLSQVGFECRAFFGNSGAEANEAAIKLARLCSKPGRHEIITMENSFHGRTMGAISATGQAKYQQGFAPLVPGFQHVPFNDLGALEQAITPKTCAIMLEPIQGEGGVCVPDKHYLTGVREICDKHDLLLILDEVQTGIGRTGHFFGYQHFQVKPDIVTLAKALGNGLPIGAMLCEPKIAAKLAPGTHASTYGGNPLVCAAALAVMETLKEDDLLTQVRQKGLMFVERLREIQKTIPGIREVRGVGLMIGVELEAPGQEVVVQALKKGLIINCTHDNVLRMLPAYTISQEHMEEGLDIFKAALTTDLSGR